MMALRLTLFIIRANTAVRSCKLSYDVVASYSLQALEGYAPGWCYPVLISQTPLIYELYVDRWEVKPEINPGKKIGEFELRRRPRGECEIIFREVPFPTRRSWTDDEKRELGGLSKDEKIKRILELDEKIREEAEAEHERLKKHFEEAVKVYFRRLKDWDITPNKVAPAPDVQSNVAKPATIPEDTTGWDTTLIEMWNNGHSRDEIAKRVKVSKDRVTNRVTELRNRFGEDIVPYDRDRKKRLIKS